MRKWKRLQLIAFVFTIVVLVVSLVFTKPIAAWLTKLEFIQILDAISKLGVLLAVIAFVAEIPQRAEQQVIQKKRAQYEAWQIIRANQGQKTSGGRIEALQDLHQDGVSLAGLDVSDAYLVGINLEGANLLNSSMANANLSEENLERTILKNSNLQKAHLAGASLQNANLSWVNLHFANLTQANLRGANLSTAYLVKSNLRGADLAGANLNKANLINATLLNTNLSEAQLTDAVYDAATEFPSGFNPTEHSMHLIEVGADLTDVDLSGIHLESIDLLNVNLTGANLTKTTLNKTDLSKVRGLTVNQVKNARNWQEAIYSDEFRRKLGLFQE